MGLCLGQPEAQLRSAVQAGSLAARSLATARMVAWPVVSAYLTISARATWAAEAGVAALVTEVVVAALMTKTTKKTVAVRTATLAIMAMPAVLESSLRWVGGQGQLHPYYPSTA
jgi:hypothetical protein